jgi:hypothetical protein
MYKRWIAVSCAFAAATPANPSSLPQGQVMSWREFYCHDAAVAKGKSLGASPANIHSFTPLTRPKGDQRHSRVHGPSLGGSRCSAGRASHGHAFEHGAGQVRLSLERQPVIGWGQVKAICTQAADRNFSRRNCPTPPTASDCSASHVKWPTGHRRQFDRGFTRAQSRRLPWSANPGSTS